MTAPRPLTQFLADLSQAHHRSVADVYREGVLGLGFSAQELQGWEGLSPSGLRDEGVHAVTYRVGLDLAQQVEADSDLAYHNRTHAAEVVLAGAWLAQAEFVFDPTHQKEAGLVLLTALVAHDLGHQGVLPNEPVGTMEAISATRCIDAWRPYGYPRAFVVAAQRVASVILGTEFTRGPSMNAALLAAHPQDWQVRVRVLANDADVLASVLAWTGMERTRRLVEERAQCGVADPAAVAGWSNRLKFLQHAVLRSQGAQVTGCVAAQGREVLAIEQQGADVLDALPQKEAQARVLAHVENV